MQELELIADNETALRRGFVPFSRPALLWTRSSAREDMVPKISHDAPEGAVAYVLGKEEGSGELNYYLFPIQFYKVK